MTASDKKALAALLEIIAELIDLNHNKAIELIKLYINKLNS